MKRNRSRNTTRGGRAAANKLVFEAAVEPPGEEIAVGGRKKTPPVLKKASAGGESKEGDLILQITIKAIDHAANLVQASSHRIGFDGCPKAVGGVGFVEGEIGGLGVHANFEEFQGDVAFHVTAITFGVHANLFEPSHHFLQVVE